MYVCIYLYLPTEILYFCVNIHFLGRSRTSERKRERNMIRFSSNSVRHQHESIPHSLKNSVVVVVPADVFSSSLFLLLMERFQKLVLIDWIHCFYIFFLAVGCWCTFLCCCSCPCYSPLFVVHRASLFFLGVFSSIFLWHLSIPFLSRVCVCVCVIIVPNLERRKTADHQQKWNRDSI